MAVAAPKLPPLMTVDDFLDWPGDGLGTRYELVDGVLRAQEGPSDAHGRIHTNVTFAITAHLRAILPRCTAVIGVGVQPRVRAEWNFRIPDLAVTCEANIQGARRVPEPLLIIEMLSPSNAADTWDNVRNYATMPSVKEIVVIHTTRALAEVLVRDGAGHWPENASEMKTNLVLASIGLDLPMSEVYRLTWLEVQTTR